MRYRIWTKCMAWILLVTMTAQLVPAALWAGEGPAKPEAASFEPVDTSDLVNLYSGDFSYNIPLIEVPGPEGSWPINVYYHGGIGPNTEATWTGLGWNLSPGAINRFVSGIPDDSWGGLTETYYWKRKAKGWGVGLSIVWGPIGMNMSYDSQMGFGYNAYLSVIGAIMSMIPSGGAAKSGADATAKGAKAAETGAKAAEAGAKAGKAAKAFSAGFDAKITMSSSSGVGMSAGLSTKVFGVVGADLGFSSDNNGDYASANVKFKGISLAQFTFSSSGEGAKFSANASGAKSQSSATSGHTQKSGFFIPIPLSLIHKALPDLSISYYQWKWWLNELHEDRGYGIIHQLGYLRNEDDPSTEQYALENIWGPQSDNVIEKLRIAQEVGNVSMSMAKYSAASNSAPTPKDYIYSKKLERDFVNDIIVSSEDIYQVNAQGISGMFQPFFSWPYKVYDVKDDDNKKDGKFDRLGHANTGSEIKFRFLDDMGGHFLNKDGGDYGSFMGRYGSRLIHPAINLKTGLIEGFEIIAADGKIYEFYQPVFNYYQFSETVHRDKKNRDRDRSYVKLSAPYASSWLLTGIKGPDYVDVTDNGFSEDDYGFWVKFTYKKADGIIPWRSPFTGIIVPDDNPYGEAYSYGARQNMYLYSIETATHAVNFVTSDREDNLSPVVTEDLEFGCLKLRDDDGDEMSSNGGKTFISYFNKQMLDQYLGPNFDAKLRIVHSYSRYDYIDVDPSIEGTDYQYSMTQAVSNFVTTMNISLPSQSNVSAEDPGTAEIHFDFPYTQFLNNDPNPSYANRKIKEAVLILTPKSQASYSQRAKKLDRIVLYKKKLYNDGSVNAYKMNTTATFTPLNTQLESVEFSYDYSLCNYAPNSTAYARGKLTLKGITKKGVNGFSYLPPTQFTYGYNPHYDAGKYDYWNGYTSAGTNSNHLNVQDKALANRDAGAWSLVSILTPLGSTIRVNYESDEIAYVGSSFIGEFRADKIGTQINHQQETTTTLNLANDDAGIANLFAAGHRKFKIAHQINSVQDYYYEDITTGQSSCTPNGNSSIEVTPVVVTSISNNQATIASAYTFLPPVEGEYSTGNCDANYVVHSYYLVPQEYTLYAGGHRVESISVEDGNDIRKTLYRYTMGTTPSLPDGYISLVDKSLLQSSGFNQLGASPGVGYGEVEVFDIDPTTNDILNGKMVYEFWTSKDKPFTSKHTKVSGGPDNLQIKDRTGIYGKIKSIKSFAVKKGKAGYDPLDCYLVKEDKMTYAYNDELPYPAVKALNDYANHAYTMGMSQRKYQSKNENDHETIVDHRYMNLYTINSSSTLYTYDLNENLTGSFSTWSDNIKFDAFTGNVLATQMRDSKGNYMINTSTPAHWYYPALLQKNMITQSATQAMYELPSGKNFNTIASIELKYYLKSFSVTTWKDWGDNVWANNDQFEATKFGSFFVNFDRWNDFNDESSNPSSGDFFIGWKRTSNITEIDRYGHPVEERSLTGQYTSSFYGYRDVLPVAIAHNARRSEVKYFNFEDRVSASAYTGQGSASYNGSIIDGQSVSAPGPNSQGDNYIATAWILPAGQAQWQHFQVILNPSQTLTISGTGQVDDIRIYPKSASMSTFCYDPVTNRLTSITDVNDISTFYEYDGAGRLIKVYDQDKNLIKRHSYQYKRQ